MATLGFRELYDLTVAYYSKPISHWDDLALKIRKKMEGSNDEEVKIEDVPF